MKNSKSAYWLLLLAVLSAAGCSKTVNTSGQAALAGQVDTAQQNNTPTPQISLTPTPTPSPSASTTSTPASADAIQAKYESAILSCDLEFPLEHNNVSVGSLGSDSFTWDLIKDSSEQKKFELNAKTFRQDLLVDFDVQNVVFETTSKTENALSVSGVYSFESATPISFLKTSSAVMGNGPFTFSENSEVELVNEYAGTVQDHASDEYSILLRCVLNTKLKPATTTTTIME